ncbi:MAG: chorismate synthase [Clostridia bacterium]
MISNVGNNIKLEVSGASHAPKITMVLKGINRGESINVEKLQEFVNRRKAKNNVYSTSRIEKDKLIITDGIENNITNGDDIIIEVANNNIKSNDYDNLVNCPRPSHADYPAFVKYKGTMDMRGGGAFSGRMTLPLVIAGGICSQILAKHNIIVGAYINEIYNINSGSYENTTITPKILEKLKQSDFPILDATKKEEMLLAIKSANDDNNSVGGKIEAIALNVPVGIGEMMFDSLESQISKVIFGIPAVKALEFGVGSKISELKGDKANDNYYYDENKKICTYTNNNGGILGGLTNGMPILLRASIKPTPSIATKQNTIDLQKKENTTLEIVGRHDACIVPRAVVCIESALAFCILDNLYNKGE